MMIIMSKANKNLLSAPEGYLRLSRNHNTVQFYNESSYIPKANTKLVKELAQKKYDKEVVKRISEEIKKENPDEHCIENVLESFPEEIRALVSPYVLSNKEFAKQWSAQSYYCKKRDGKYLTAKGENVRSKSEVIIADRLNLAGIPYRYEARLKILENNTVYNFYPDFTLLKKKTREEIILEHFGMMDNQEYADNAISKINLYSKNGFIQGKNIFFTFESAKIPLDVETLDNLISYLNS